ncbi:MAG TPA: hypothetical protein VGQ55_03815, partial [Pyrinomonadaceae bacterium]|nr:hypothetical protein [Pyrinomonadaceae bacterium]
NVVREDPVRKGMLYAGTERQVYVSLDDGENWQSLRVNMPATSIRDLIVKNDDLAVATHGRGFWILDNVTPLRQLESLRATHLFTPQAALRVRWNLNTDTPLPPDEASQENPPDGAAIDYYLASSAKDVELEIKDEIGRLVRRYTSDDVLPEPKDTNNVPAYWIRRPQKLSNLAGAHRFYWDLHYAPVPGVPPDYPISANYGNTAPIATGPWVHPGKYKVELRVDGKEHTETIEIKMDPRVRAMEAALKKQFDLSMQLYELRIKLEQANQQVNSLASQLDAARKSPAPAVATQVDALVKKLNALAENPGRRPGSQLSLAVIDRVVSLFDRLQEVDAEPTTSVETATLESVKKGNDTLAQLDAIIKSDVAAMQDLFKANNLEPLKLTSLQVKYHLVGDEDDDDDDPRAKP